MIWAAYLVEDGLIVPTLEIEELELRGSNYLRKGIMLRSELTFFFPFHFPMF